MGRDLCLDFILGFELLRRVYWRSLEPGRGGFVLGGLLWFWRGGWFCFRTDFRSLRSLLFWSRLFFAWSIWDFKREFASSLLVIFLLILYILIEKNSSICLCLYLKSSIFYSKYYGLSTGGE